jgi:1,4-dihydroxy-2-naphthoate octaprenyltransferase
MASHFQGVPPDGMLGTWVQAVRPHFVVTSIMPAILGSIVAWSRFGAFDAWFFLLVVIGVTVNHCGLNMLDDVFDYLNAVDHAMGDEKNPYTGGSGVLTDGTLSVGQVRIAAVACFVLTGLIALYLTIAAGWAVLLFSAIGVFSSVFYTAPPIRFGYRGLGELGLLINFGPVICLGAFYVQTGSIALEPCVISLVPGFMMWSMIVINEIPDYEEDRRAGKLNLVARFGRKAGIALYGAGLVAAYGVMVASVVAGVCPFTVLLGLLTLPIAYGSWSILRAHYRDKMLLAPANLAMIKVHSITSMLLIFAYMLAVVFI